MTNDNNTTSAASVGLNSTGAGFMTHSPAMSVPRVLVSLALTAGVCLIVVFFADRGRLKAALPANETIVAYLTGDAEQITARSRDAALAALNGGASALLLTQNHLVTSFQ